MSSPLFNPAFQVYNQAVTAHDRSLEVTKYIDNNDDTRILTKQQYDAINDPDKEYDYNAAPSGPVTDAEIHKWAHVGGIDKAVKKFPLTQQGSLHLASISNDDRYRLEGVARNRQQTGSKGRPEITHTMGDYLLPAYKEFQTLQLKNANFWEWVEEEIAKDPATAAKRWNPTLYNSTDQKYHSPMVTWFKAGVKYINETQTRDRYKVTFKGGLLYRLLRSSDNEPVLFDKKEVIDHFTKNGKPAGSLIWVMGSSEFYSHMAKIGRFHHSSFFSGGSLTAAGEWDAENGKLKWISGQSGHYRPGFDFLVDAVKALPADVLAGGAKVRLFKQKTAVDLPPDQFLKDAAIPGALIAQGLAAFPA